MTLCIAAECRGHVIVGSDFRGEDDYTSAENQNKLEWLEDTWPVLIAGTVSRAHDLVAALNREFAEARRKSTVIDDKNVQVILRRASRKQKYQLADEIVSRELGIQYAVFLKDGKGFLSEKSFEEIEGEVRKVDLGCELIVVFFLIVDPISTAFRLTFRSDERIIFVVLAPEKRLRIPTYLTVSTTPARS